MADKNSQESSKSSTAMTIVKAIMAPFEIAARIPAAVYVATAATTLRLFNVGAAYVKNYGLNNTVGSENAPSDAMFGAAKSILKKGIPGVVVDKFGGDASKATFSREDVAQGVESSLPSSQDVEAIENPASHEGFAAELQRKRLNSINNGGGGQSIV